MESCFTFPGYFCDFWRWWKMLTGKTGCWRVGWYCEKGAMTVSFIEAAFWVVTTKPWLCRYIRLTQASKIDGGILRNYCPCAEHIDTCGDSQEGSWPANLPLLAAQDSKYLKAIAIIIAERINRPHINKSRRVNKPSSSSQFDREMRATQRSKADIRTFYGQCWYGQSVKGERSTLSTP